MDPVSAIALAASIAQLGVGVAKTLNALCSLRKKYKEASFTVSMLISQLSTIKAALDQVTEWVTTSLVHAPQHQQLVSDLELAVEGCKLMILVLGNHVDRLELSESASLGHWATIQDIWDEGSMQEYSSQLGCQTDALNLLLTAFQCRSLSRQQELLERKESRSTIQVAVDRSSSVWAQYEVDSSLRGERASVSEDWTALNVHFDFDDELLHSKAYQKTLVASMRQAIHHPPIVSESSTESTDTVLVQRTPTTGTVAHDSSLHVMQDQEKEISAEAHDNGRVSSSADNEVAAPTGYLCLVSTEIKDSVYWWESYPISMGVAVKLHDDLVCSTLCALNGYLVKRRQSEGFLVAFHSALEALRWCLMIQKELMDIAWPNEILNDARARQIVSKYDEVVFRGIDVSIALDWCNPISITNPLTHRMDYVGPVIHNVTSLNRVTGVGQLFALPRFAVRITGELDVCAMETENGMKQDKDDPARSVCKTHGQDRDHIAS